MLASRWLRKVMIGSRMQRLPSARPRVQPKLESLEDRLVPAIRTWTGAGINDLWSNAANWDTGAPVDGDDIRISSTAASAEVLFDTSVAGTGVSINSLTSDGTNPVGEPFRITGDTLTVNGLGTFALGADLTLSGGTLTGTGTLTVSGLTTWTGGTMSGVGGVINADGGLVISGTGNKDITQLTLNASGSSTWSGTGVRMGNGAVLHNTATGIFDVQSNDTIVNLAGTSSIINDGLFKRTTGTGTMSTNQAAFNNAGTLQVQSGTLALNNGGTSTGSFTADVGGVLNFSGGTHTLGASSSVSGTGTVRFSAGTVNVGGAYGVSGTTEISGGIANFNAVASSGITALSNGTLGGTGIYTTTGLFTWTGGTMSGVGGVTNADGGLVIGGTGNKDLTQRTLNTGGSSIWSGTGVRMGNGGTLHNTATGTFDVQSNDTIVNLGGVTSIVNDGLFKRTTSTGTMSTNQAAFNNAGTLQVQSGTLALNNGGTSTGSFTADVGGVLNFSGGTHTLGASSSVGGTGTVRFSAGTVNVGGAYGVSGTTEINGGIANCNAVASSGITALSNGTLGGTGIYTTTGLFTWTGGTMSGVGGVTNADGGLVIGGTGNKDLTQRTLNTGGSSIWSGTGVRMGNGGTLHNTATGTFDVQSNDTIVNLGGVTSIVNDGLFKRTTSTGTMNANQAGFTNNGTIDVQTGTLTLLTLTNFASATNTLTGGTYLVTGTLRFNGANIVTNAATLVLDGAASALLNNTGGTNGLVNFAINTATGNFTLQNGRNITTPAFSNAGNVTIGATSTFLTSAGNYSQTAGATTVLGILDSAATVDVQGGLLRGTGTINSNVTNAGQVNPGLSPGILTINGNYAGAGSGVLNIELNGTTAGTQHDQLKVNGNVSLTNTTLNAARGFASAVTDAFTIIDNDGGDAVTGTFSGLAEGSFITLGGQRFQITYAGGDGNDVVLTHINTAPVLAPIGNRTVDEEALLTFTASATDVDAPPGTFSFSLDAGAPVGASIDAATGVFTWTPTEAQGPGIYNITIRVSDNGPPVLSAFETITVTVNEVNLAPVLANIGDQSGDEETTISFTASATDPDLPANNLTFSLLGAPTGASINATTGVFTWTPTEAQGPGTFSFSVRVTDNGSPNLFDEETITVTVSEVNEAPVLAAIGNQTVDEESLLSFTATATDPDLPGNALAFSLIGAPVGASINPATGAFAWMPTEAQGPGVFTFTIRVTDNASPNLFDEETITVTVNEVNLAPVLASIGNQTLDEGATLNFTASATDADMPENDLSFSLIGAPAGASIDASTGEFSWTPTETQGPGLFTFTVRVTDNGSPNLFDEETISITVNEVNEAPVLAAIGDRNGTAGTLITFTASASDPDLPANALSFSLDPGAPAEASINSSTGFFSFTPTVAGIYNITIRVTDDGVPALDDAETITITVSSGNLPPTNLELSSASVPENSPVGTTIGMFATTDPNAGDTHTYTLVTGSGDVDNAAFTIVGNELRTAAGFDFETRSSYSIRVRTTDQGNLFFEKSFTITITNINEAPTANASGPYSVAEGGNVILAGSGTDPDAGDTLTYQWDLDNNGTFETIGKNPTFSAAGLDGPSSRTVTLRVTDNGGLSHQSSATIQITNVAPTAVNDAATTNEDQAVSINVLSNDSDPAGALDPLQIVSVTNGSKGTTSIDNKGTADTTDDVIVYTPNANATGTDSFTYTISDGDGGTATATVTVNITPVNDAPVITSDGGGNSAARSVPENTTAVTTVTASDVDAGATLTFSISGGADAAKFTINASTGELRFVTAPDFEAPTDAGGNNVYDVQVQVSDGSLTDTQMIAVTVTNVSDQSPVYLGQGPGGSTALFAQGTEGNDNIRFKPHTCGMVKVVYNGQDYLFAAGSFTSIVAYGGGGHDKIGVAAAIEKRAYLFGGAGNDTLQGGSGDDVILGGEGNDQLIGRQGRDLLIGGWGSDRIVGNADDDILIAGTTDFDNNTAALCAIMAEWTRCDLGYQNRVAHLRYGGGLNGSVKLSEQTVHDDGAADTLTGSAGRDWFFANLDTGVLDTITDDHNNEFEEDLD